MVTSRFFIENSQLIGLWMIYSISMWLGVCILDLIFDTIKQKISKKRRLEAKKLQRRQAILRKIEEKNSAFDRERFSIQFRKYVVDFEI